MASVTAVIIVLFTQTLLLSYLFVYSKMNVFYLNPFTKVKIVVNVIFVLVPAAVFGTLVLFAPADKTYIGDQYNTHYEDYNSLVCYIITRVDTRATITYAIGFIFIYTATFVATSLYFLVKIYKKFKNPPSFVTATTLKLQKMIFSNVLVQSLVPVVFVAVPFLTAIGYAVIFDDGYGQVLFKVALVSITFHSLVSCSLVIWVTKPYRKHLIAVFQACIKFGHKEATYATPHAMWTVAKMKKMASD